MSASVSSVPAAGGRLLAAVAVLAAVGALAWIGWTRVSAMPVGEVRVEGARMADADRIREIARIDAESLLVDVSPAIVSDRVRRHPWVRDAETSRVPDGSVRIRVTERTPVLLVLSDDGRPGYYVDRDGHRMPFVAGRGYPVPLLRGFREAYHPVRLVQDAAVRELAATLPSVEPETDALLSEFLVDDDGGIVLLTSPAPSGQMVPVRLGRSGFTARFRKLRAFWDQAVLPRPDVRYASVDLRFDSQIITRESS